MKPIPLSIVLNLAVEFFKDKDKAFKWWMSKSEKFDGKSPFEVSKEGKGNQVVKFLESCGI